MDTIQQPDQFIDSYIYEKTTNPDARIVWKQYERRLVDRTDRIVELAHGERDVVKTQSDWHVVSELLNFWCDEFPLEFQDFKNQIVDIRRSRNADGYSSTREIKYVGALPPRFMKMIKIIFPFQQFDKTFMNKLVNKITLFKVGGENNMSKGRSIIS
jgi:hypothetical protein